MKKQRKPIAKPKLQVWHTSNFGHEAFYVEVTSVEEAILILKVLADYDLYQGERVTANAQGLNMWDEDRSEWIEYEDEEGRDIDEIAEAKRGAKSIERT